MPQPSLVILAAGMGSRFGGLKQIMAVDDFGHAILDFSLYDARRAGFGKVVFIIKREIEDDFKAAVGRRAEKYFDVRYVYQELDRLPAPFRVPEGRVKPWGTGHAVLCAGEVVDGPFAVINADDFYGSGAYQTLYDFLAAERPDNVERTHIEKRGDGAAYTEDGVSFTPLSGDTPVSMNFWGFGADMLRQLEARFPAWLEENLKTNPLKAEYFLPFVAGACIKEGLATVQVLNCHEQWYGMTYKEDMARVKAAIRALRDRGVYPEKLLD